MEEFSLQLYYKVPNDKLNMIRKLIMIHRHCILWIRLAFVFTINEQKQFFRGSRPVFTGSTMSNECAMLDEAA